jgi:formate dehydrogenase major subunit
MLCIGQNPATSLNASVERKGLRHLEWLVVKDNWVTETAAFWSNAPEIKRGEVKPQDIKTEVFFFPSAQVAEYEGSFTNTFRMLQWHFKAADPPGECRSDLWFTHQLAQRLTTRAGAFRFSGLARRRRAIRRRRAEGLTSPADSLRIGSPTERTWHGGLDTRPRRADPAG